MSQPFKLYRLQQIDSQLDQMKARLKEIEESINDTTAIDNARDDFALSEDHHRTAQKALQRIEEIVQAQKYKIEQTEASLYGGKIHNPKELQGLQTEAMSLKKYLEQLEDRQLEAMIFLEESGEIYQQALRKLERVQKEHDQLSTHLLAEQANLNKEIERLTTERQGAQGGIPESDMNLYESLRNQRKGIAVSVVTDKTCSACGSTLNAALLQSARSLNQLARCDSCGRILYGG